MVEADRRPGELRKPDHEIPLGVGIVGDPSHAHVFVTRPPIFQPADRELAVRHVHGRISRGEGALTEVALGLERSTEEQQGSRGQHVPPAARCHDHAVMRMATSVDVFSPPSLAVTSMRNSPGGRLASGTSILVTPGVPAGAIVSAVISSPSRFSSRAVSVGVPAELCAPTRTSRWSARRNSRTSAGIALASAASICHSRSELARNTCGVLKVRPRPSAGMTSFLVSRSRTSAAAFSTERSRSTGPGGTSNSTRDGTFPAEGDAGGAPGAALGTLPRKYRSEFALPATSEMRAGVSPRTPGGGGIGSHTNVTFVLPLLPGDMPIHVRIKLRRAPIAKVPSASETALG